MKIIGFGNSSIHDQHHKHPTFLSKSCRGVQKDQKDSGPWVILRTHHNNSISLFTIALSSHFLLVYLHWKCYRTSMAYGWFGDSSIFFLFHFFFVSPLFFFTETDMSGPEKIVFVHQDNDDASLCWLQYFFSSYHYILFSLIMAFLCCWQNKRAAHRWLQWTITIMPSRPTPTSDIVLFPSFRYYFIFESKCVSETNLFLISLKDWNVLINPHFSPIWPLSQFSDV